MINKLLAFNRKYNLICPGDQVVCAISGGADSVAMLFALYLLREKLEISLSAAHFNHNLRGAESDGDEAFVRGFCDRYDIPLFVGSAKVEAGKKGLEAAAREARYAFFETLPGKIATAHTADDNGETVLLHLIRGTGLKGLGAIAPQRGRIIRPMLSVTRQELLAFLAEYNLSYREDSSNDTDDFLRNRIRHHIMPLLTEENPKISENLSAMALRLRHDEQALAAAAADLPVEVSALRNADPSLRSRALESFLKGNGVKEPEAEHIAQAEALVFSDKPGAEAAFPGGITVRRCYDKLVAQSRSAMLTPTKLNCPGETLAGNYRIICGPAADTEGGFTLPAGKYTVRSRQTGDKICLSGGTKSLKKLFIDQKIPAHLRPGIPVIADEQGVAAVCGIGADLRCAGNPVWRITTEEINAPLPMAEECEKE